MLNIQNIQGEFRGAGIFPFDPDKVLYRITSSTPPPTVQAPQSTPSIITPFNDSVLTSSPADINAVHIANAALI